MREWMQIATEAAVVRRALKTTAAVGAILIAINHGAALIHGNFSSHHFLQMALTVLVPYCVSTSSSVAAIREARASR